MSSAPLVSIGVPTFNRAHLLERALHDLLGQTHRPIEIVITDNASDDETAAVCAKAGAGRGIIRYFRQTRAVPPPENFRTALRLSSGEYFMWAADDDGWDPTFVHALLDRLQQRPGAALVAAEARYQLADGTALPFLAEGGPWYGPSPRSVEQRLREVVRHNYGNLIYGLYRKRILIEHGRTVLDDWRSPNEIPVFLQVAARGGIEVLPEVLFRKTAPLSTYAAVARERGVELSELPMPATKAPERVGTGQPALKRVLQQAAGTSAYHAVAWSDCMRAIRSLPVPTRVRRDTAAALTSRLVTHGLSSVLAAAARSRKADAVLGFRT